MSARTTNANSETPPDEEPTIGAPAKSDNYRTDRWEFSLDVSRFDYSEYVQAPAKSTETGMLVGVFASYRHQNSPSSHYTLLTFEFSPSSTQYDGTTQAPTYAPVKQGTSNRFFRTEGTFGFNIRCPDAHSYCISATAGLGGRFWVRGDTTNLNGILSPSELYYWLYLPFGVRLDKEFESGWGFYLDASARWMFLGGITIRFSELTSDLDDAHGSLGAKLGGRIEFGVSKKVSEAIAIQLAPWYEYSAIGNGSTFDITSGNLVIGRGYEPASRTYQLGARVGVVWGF